MSQENAAQTFSMKETCARVGISYETLKFYCNQGLVPNVKRADNNYRYFDQHDITWIKGLLFLKKCGMGIDEMRHYVELCLAGTHTIPERQSILRRKQAEVKKQIEELQMAEEFITHKLNYYNERIASTGMLEASDAPIITRMRTHHPATVAANANVAAQIRQKPRNRKAATTDRS